MNTPRQPTPEWITRGKTIRQLIEELRSFEDQNLEVRISIDCGDTHRAISIVKKLDAKYCVLVNSAGHSPSEGQDLQGRGTDDV
jgi:hypothetical protein